TISPEYFTKLKFHQFAWANLGWPPRAFAAEIGFLASWYVGLIAGWLLARLGLAELSLGPGQHHVARAMGILVAVAALTGGAGVLLGLWVTENNDAAPWHEWRDYFRLQDLRSFIIVAY